MMIRSTIEDAWPGRSPVMVGSGFCLRDAVWPAFGPVDRPGTRAQRAMPGRRWAPAGECRSSWWAGSTGTGRASGRVDARRPALLLGVDPRAPNQVLTWWGRGGLTSI